MSEDTFEPLDPQTSLDELAAIDAPRALPDGMRARIEHALTDMSISNDDVDLHGIDAPRRVPERTRVRLEGAMSVAARDAIEGIDQPRALPRSLRARLEVALAGSASTRSSRGWQVRGVGIAAALVLFAASALAVSRTGGPGTSDVPIAGPERPDGGASVSDDGGVLAPGPLVVGDAPLPGAPTTPDAVGSHGGGAGPAPPFGNIASLGWTAAPLTTGPSKDDPAQPLPAAKEPITLAVASGGGAQDEGFFAYLALLNRLGGVRGRPIITIDAEEPRAARAIATVNLQDFLLGSAPVAPVLESIAAPEIVLDGSVLGFGSPPERQAHLIARHVFPEAATAGTAVVYHTDEDGFSDRIPDAIEETLAPQGITVLRVPFDPDEETLLVPGDAAFLSMRTEHARAWLQRARAENHRPDRGIAGIYTLADPDLRSLMPSDTRFVSPYAFPSGEERAAIQRESGQPINADLIHGWVTAKAIAVAIWISAAETSDVLTATLTGAFAGWESGMFPAYTTREGTRARTPEGVVYAVRSNRFVAETGFLRDDP